MYFYVFVAAVAALYFAGTAMQRPRPGVIAAAIAWLLYAVYEYFVANGTLCDANCNIRVDLILIWPLVWIATLFGVYAPGQWTGAAKVLGGVSLFFLACTAALFLYGILVEKPAAERAAREKACAQGQGGPECPPAAAPSTGSTTEQK
ncbi:MAG: hypothetical protein AB7J30_10600 [Hyphomicrobium sp.]|uniref:hypothetical protein n=1 Tax=Hyphomicrobium sp. TaxID=82 RepID=UPI003D12455E